MRGGFLLCAIVSLLCAASGTVCAADAGKTDSLPSLDYLSKWEGHNAYVGLIPPSGADLPVTLWDDPNVAALLKKILPDALIQKIHHGWTGNDLVVSGAILKKGQVLAIPTCRPHACAFDNAVVYIDIQKKKMAVCWGAFDPQKKQQKTIWVDESVRELPVYGCSMDNPFALYSELIK